VAACRVVAGDGAAAPAEPRDTAAEKAVTQLLNRMEDGGPATWREFDKRMEKITPALRALGKDALPPLRRRLQPGKEDIRAILALAYLGRDAEEAVPDLLRILKSERKTLGWPHYRILAAGAALQIKPDWTKHLPFLVAALDDPQLIDFATEALEQMGPRAEVVLPELIKRMGRVAPPGVTLAMGTTPRFVALIGGIGPPAKAAIPRLLDALRHEEAGVREAAAWALARIGQQPKEVVPALRRCLRDEDKQVRRRAANALGAFGPAARPALPDLRESERDPEWAVRLAAALAIISIERPPSE
jgi:HEAT repeat protein